MYSSGMKHPLRQYREENNLSQEALGEKLGVTGMTVHRWESGRRLPHMRLWSSIWNETGVRWEEMARFKYEAAE